ncbi:MAG TPA: ribbon-helix-helix protein, CopG family [Mycobacteriales bacterium]|nr:ribbon-helix-helix protein, CopG family [Mycobacteriales bacterium]
MRTTVEFEPDAARAIEQLRRERGLGVSEAVNELIRRGLLPRRTERRFRQRTAPLGLQVDVSNVAEALDALEGPTAR